MDPMLIVSLLIGIPLLGLLGFLWSGEEPSEDNRPDAKARWFE